MHNTKTSMPVWLNTNRIYICLVVVLILMPILILASGHGIDGVGNFFGSGNMVPVLETSILYIMVGIGFTYVMIGGNFDLSVGAMINVGACISIGSFNFFYSAFGGEAAGAGGQIGAWIIALLLTLVAGIICGSINGWLVAYGKVHSFIVTIGTLTAYTGFVYTFCNGNTLSAKSSDFTDLLEKPINKMLASGYVKASYLDILTPKFLIMVVVLVFFAILLSKARWGRDFLMTGSNREAAWQSGIDVDRKIMMSFIISGLTSTTAGALFAISMNAAVPNFGERGINPLMLTLAATIIGGTVMTGGSGDVIKTAVAVITLEVIFSGLIIMGMGFDAQVLAAGILLALIVLYEAYSLYRQAQRKGIRPALLKEADELKKRYKEQKI